MQHVAETAQGLKGKVLKKIVCFAQKNLGLSLYFTLFFLLMVLYDVTFNVTATI
jgi:hypothetical protein